jgi:gliding motility-associated lipoprotein GldH
MNRIRKLLCILVPCALYLVSCTTIDLYEKTVAIPAHAWKSSFKPSFHFTIKDTSSPYQVLLVLRHTEKYNFTNIYLNLSIQSPGQDSSQTIRMDLPLATNEGWLGTGMDDIYEHRISLAKYLVENNFSIKRPGDYVFTLEQIMREDPLEHVLNAGLRIEKKQP